MADCSKHRELLLVKVRHLNTLKIISKKHKKVLFTKKYVVWGNK